MVTSGITTEALKMRTKTPMVIMVKASADSRTTTFLTTSFSLGMDQMSLSCGWIARMSPRIMMINPRRVKRLDIVKVLLWYEFVGVFYHFGVRLEI